MTGCAFCDDILREGLDCADLIATAASNLLLDGPRPSYAKRKEDLERWLAEPLDPAYAELPTDTLIERLGGTSSLKTREKIVAVLKRRAYRDPATIDAMRAAFRNPDAEVRFRMRACLYIVLKMLRLADSLQSEDLKKEAEKLEKEGKRHRSQANDYYGEANAQESQADDLEKSGDTDGAKKKRGEAAKTRERERRAYRRAREADTDQAEAEDDQEEADADEKAEDDKVKDKQKRKDEREARRKEREVRRKKRAEEAKTDRDEDNAN